MRKLYAAVKGSMRTTARAPTALAKRWTVRMDGVPLPLSMRATTLWVRDQPAKYSATRSKVQVATPAPKKSASSVHTGQPIAMALAGT